MQIDLDNHGCMVISDEADGYRLVLRPVGRTAELIYKILVERKMGRSKLGQAGAPIQSTISLNDQIDLIKKRKAEELVRSLPGADVELDL